MKKQNRAYFVASLQEKEKYQKYMIKATDFLREKGYKVWDDVNQVDRQHAQSYTDNEMQRYFTKVEKRIRNCDIFVAEISTNSISIGYEIGYAIANSKPALLLRHSSLLGDKLGAPIRGNASKLMNVHYYDPETLESEIAKFLRKAEKGILVKRLPIEFTQGQVDYIKQLQFDSDLSFNAAVRKVIQDKVNSEEEIDEDLL